jgi:hypothetical protein
MSHTYFITRDDTPTGERLEEVGLSNTSHADWMEKAKLTRTMRNTETGDTEEWPFSTTIHDPQPLCLCINAFSDYVDLAQEVYGEEVPQHMQMLYDFIASVEAHEQENNTSYQIWLY